MYMCALCEGRKRMRGEGRAGLIPVISSLSSLFLHDPVKERTLSSSFILFSFIINHFAVLISSILLML